MPNTPNAIVIVQPPPPPPTAGDWVFLATLNENMIDKEHTLTNHRMAWMMSTQGFLFGAFCIILINKPEDQRTAKMLLNLIPVLATLVAIAASFGILAAQAVAKVLERERSSYRQVLSTLFSYPEMPDIGCLRVGKLSWTRNGGVWPPRIILLAVTLLWFLVLLGRFGITFGITDRGF